MKTTEETDKSRSEMRQIQRLWGIDPWPFGSAGQCANQQTQSLAKAHYVDSGAGENANRIHASKLCICTLNPWSVCNKTTSLHDFIIGQLDLFALTENWLTR